VENELAEMKFALELSRIGEGSGYQDFTHRVAWDKLVYFVAWGLQ